MRFCFRLLAALLLFAAAGARDAGADHCDIATWPVAGFRTPLAAHAGDGYLVLWHDDENAALRGATFDSAGILRRGDLSYEWVAPELQIAAGADAYLVYGVSPDDIRTVRGALIDTDGSVIRESFELGSGVGMLGAWDGESWALVSIEGTALHLFRLGEDGDPVLPPVLVVQSDLLIRNASVGRAGDVWWVVWIEDYEQLEGGSIYHWGRVLARRVGRDGTLLDAEPLLIAERSTGGVFDRGADEIVVAFGSQENDSLLWFLRLGPEGPLAAAEPWPLPDIARGGQLLGLDDGWIMISQWDGGEFPREARPIDFLRMDAAWMPTGDPVRVALGNLPFGATAGASYLVAFARDVPSSEGGADATIQVVHVAGDGTIAEPVIVASVHVDQEYPDCGGCELVPGRSTERMFGVALIVLGTCILASRRRK